MPNLLANAQITPRERQILAGLSRGQTDKQIAWELCISPKTVDKHNSNIKEKMDLDNMRQLIVFAVKYTGAGL